MMGELPLSAPLTVNWSLSYRCNFACAHCYSRGEKECELPLPDLVRIAGLLREKGVVIVNFGGGEPLLDPRLLPLARRASRMGLRVSMNTNGWLLDDEAAGRIAAAGFAGVGVSIDSPRAEEHDRFRSRPGSFARATQALEALRKAGVPATVSTVIYRGNLADWQEMIGLCRAHAAGTLFLHNYKCTGNGFINMGELDLAPGEWRDFYREAIAVRDRLGAGGGDPRLSFDDPIMASLPGYRAQGAVQGSTCGKLSLHLRPDGDVTPCGFIPAVIGNILRDDFDAMWNDSPVLRSLREKTAKGKCRGCGSYQSCLGGCSARAFALTGDFSSPDPHCWEKEEEG
jgi:GeoRSP system radical SAM/SPASM protein